jgi:hypothetical protein
MTQRHSSGTHNFRHTDRVPSVVGLNSNSAGGLTSSSTTTAGSITAAMGIFTRSLPVSLGSLTGWS